MPVFEHIHFRKQKKGTRLFRPALDTAIAALTGAPVFADANKLTQALRNKVYQRCQMHDQNQTLVDVYFKTIPNSARCRGDADWCIYYARDARNLATNIQLLMIGRVLDPNNALEEFFDFRIDDAARIAFDGTYQPQTNQSVDMNYPQTVISEHNRKHFGADRRANQYDIGNDLATRMRIVRGLEEKAITWGAKTDAEAYFMFDRRVGYQGTDGTNPGNACVCIRVDSPGGETQHSHPIPIDGAGGHDAKIKDVIRYLTVKKQEGLPGLVQLARYLRIISMQPRRFRNLREQRGLYAGTRPPECVYWEW